MSRTLRYVLFAMCAVEVILGTAYFLQLPWATALWPFENTSAMSFVFLSSIFAAAAASTLWGLLTRNEGAIAGIALDFSTILAPVSLHALLLARASGSQGLMNYAIFGAVGAVFGVWLFLKCVRIPIDTTIPMPPLVRLSFVAFIGALCIVGARLVLRTPNILPWQLTPEMGVSVGCMFFGAAVYFLYGLLRPSWNNAATQLAGFLAYDLVLIGPFLRALPTVAPEHQRPLYIYITVVVYSGLLAVFYLFINPTTRVFARQPLPQPAATAQTRLAAAGR